MGQYFRNEEILVILAKGVRRKWKMSDPFSARQKLREGDRGRLSIDRLTTKNARPSGLQRTTVGFCTASRRIMKRRRLGKGVLRPVELEMLGGVT